MRAIAPALSAAVFAFSLFAAGDAGAQLFSDKEARAQLQQQREQLKQLANHIVEMRKQNNALTQELARIVQRLQKAEADMRALRGAMEELREAGRQNGEREKLLAAMQKQIGAVKKELAEVRGGVADLGKNIAEMSEFVSLPPEQQLYDSAFSEFQSKRYQSALDGFRRVQKFYPHGKFHANAGYWIGNSLLAVKDFEGVIANSHALIAQHGESDKAPDALLLMARAYAGLGKKREAEKILRRIVSEYATSLAADKARQQLAP